MKKIITEGAVGLVMNVHLCDKCSFNDEMSENHMANMSKDLKEK